jgi:hypothetical protein
MKRVKGLLMVFILMAGTGIWFACEKEGDDGANHNVMNDCLVCHKAGGGGKGIFTAGGTVYKSGTNIGATGATIKLYANADGSGSPVATMTSEVGGNFYSTASINFGTGLYVIISSATGTSSMAEPVTTGACNSCHSTSQLKITVE